MAPRRRRIRDAAEVRADWRLPAALIAGYERHDRQALLAGAWAHFGIGGKTGVRSAEGVIQRASNVTVAAIELPKGIQVRASLAKWGGRDLAHLRTWFEGRDGRWRPTKRGVTVPPEKLEELEAAVRALREARDARATGT